MSCGRAYKDHLQNEKVLLLTILTGLRFLNNPFSLIIQLAYLFKIKNQFENIILSMCLATNRIYSITVHKTANENVSKHLLFCNAVVILWTVIE